MIVPRVRIQAIGMFESGEGVDTDGGGQGEGLKTCGRLCSNRQESSQGV